MASIAYVHAANGFSRTWTRLDLDAVAFSDLLRIVLDMLPVGL
jgi:hypothetical protein